MATYRRWVEVITDDSGIVIPTVTVTVYEAGTTNKINLYTDHGSTSLSNPFTTGADGVASFFADFETYKEITVVLSKTGYDFTDINSALTYLSVGW